MWVDKASPNELQTNNSETPLHSASEDIQEMEASTQNGKQVRNALENAFSTFRDRASLFEHPASQLPPSPTSRSQLSDMGLPCGPVAKTPCLPFRESRIDPWLGNQLPYATMKNASMKDPTCHNKDPCATIKTWHSQINK